MATVASYPASMAIATYNELSESLHIKACRGIDHETVAYRDEQSCHRSSTAFSFTMKLPNTTPRHPDSELSVHSR